MAQQVAVQANIAALYVHPIKSCGGIAVDDALLIETGLEFYRAWMVVDARGHFVTQRDVARMAVAPVAPAHVPGLHARRRRGPQRRNGGGGRRCGGRG